MSAVEEQEVKDEIAHIIDMSRHCEERFLTDSKQAAFDIFQYLESKLLLIKT